MRLGGLCFFFISALLCKHFSSPPRLSYRPGEAEFLDEIDCNLLTRPFRHFQLLHLLLEIDYFLLQLLINLSSQSLHLGIFTFLRSGLYHFSFKTAAILLLE